MLYAGRSDRRVLGPSSASNHSDFGPFYEHKTLQAIEATRLRLDACHGSFCHATGTIFTLRQPPPFGEYH